MSLHAILPPDHHFTDAELSRVHFEPFGALNVFRCADCKWNIQRSGFGLAVPYFVAMQGVREVLTHWRGAHG